MPETGTLEGLYRQALAHHAAARPDLALRCFRQLVSKSPATAASLVGLGAVLASAGSPASAIAVYGRALAADPWSAEGLCNRAMALAAAGRAAEALRDQRRSLASRPGLGAAHDGIGRSLLGLGHAAAAGTAHRRAISCDPESGLFHGNLGHALRATGSHRAALGCYRRALGLSASDPAAHANVAGSLLELGLRKEALATLYGAIALMPASVELIHALAVALGRSVLLVSRRVSAIDPCFAPAWVDAGIAWQEAGELAAALRSYRSAIALAPGLMHGLHNLGAAALQRGLQPEGEILLRRAVALATADPKIYSDLLFTLCFREQPRLEAIARDHREFDRRFARPLERQTRHRNDPDPRRPLRVGYVAANLYHHPAGQALLGIFEHHDRRAFHLVAYADEHRTDALTQRLRRLVERWVAATGLSDAALAAAIEQDQIDILVDCIGHLPNGRLLAFARKPAPVQISYPVYPNTTGLSAIDYRVADPHTTPLPLEAFYSERQLRLPELYACPQMPDFPEQPAAAPPVESAGVFTFASFNNPAKLGPRTLACWAEILKRAPTARLCLKWRGMDMDAPAVAQLIRQGASARQIKVLGWTPNPFSPYRDVDCCLDPMVNGGNTTLEALWMGTPVVTLRGVDLFSRVGAGFLGQIGLEALVADTAERYVEIALGLANDGPRLRRIRAGLRERILGAPAMDAARYTRFLESGYRAVWQRWCARLPPAPLSIGADASASWDDDRAVHP